MADNRPGYLPVMGEAAEKDFVQWALAVQKQGLPVGRKIVIQKAYEIHRYMFGSMSSVGSVRWGWCDLFMSRNDKLTLITAQVIKRAGNNASLEGLRSFFCKLCKHIIEQKIKK